MVFEIKMLSSKAIYDLQDAVHPSYWITHVNSQTRKKIILFFFIKGSCKACHGNIIDAKSSFECIYLRTHSWSIEEYVNI